jgi:hypothetical protein
MLKVHFIGRGMHLEFIASTVLRDSHFAHSGHSRDSSVRRTKIGELLWRISIKLASYQRYTD